MQRERAANHRRDRGSLSQNSVELPPFRQQRSIDRNQGAIGFRCEIAIVRQNLIQAVDPVSEDEGHYLSARRLVPVFLFIAAPRFAALRVSYKVEGSYLREREILVDHELGCIPTVPVPGPVYLAQGSIVDLRIVRLKPLVIAEIALGDQQAICGIAVVPVFDPIDVALAHKLLPLEAKPGAPVDRAIVPVVGRGPDHGHSRSLENALVPDDAGPHLLVFEDSPAYPGMNDVKHRLKLLSVIGELALARAKPVFLPLFHPSPLRSFSRA